MATPIWNDTEKRWKMRESINGKQRVFTSSRAGAKGLAEVRRKRNAALEGEAEKSSWRLEKCWLEYLADVASRTGLESENYVQREKYGRLYILPQLGKKRVGLISSIEWQRVINESRGNRVKNLSRKTRKNILGTISDFAHFAIRSRMIDQLPIGLYVPKDAPVVGKEILQPDQLRVVLSQECGSWYFNAWRFMVVTGFRPGEVLGLQNSDITDEVITIRRSVNSRGQITSGKNRNAQRQHKLNAFSRKILADQKELLKEAGIQFTHWVFPAPDGGQPSPHRSYKQWISFSSKHGIKVPPYSLRHTFVSLTKDLPEAYLRMIIGHSKSMDTYGTYSHRVNGDLDKAALMIEEIFIEHLK